MSLQLLWLRCLNADNNWNLPPTGVKICVSRWLRMFRCNSAPTERYSHFTDDHNRSGQILRLENPVRFGAIGHCFVPNNPNSSLWRPFIDTRMVLYWKITFWPSIGIEPEARKYKLSQIPRYHKHWESQSIEYRYNPSRLTLHIRVIYVCGIKNIIVYFP